MTETQATDSVAQEPEPAAEQTSDLTAAAEAETAVVETAVVEAGAEAETVAVDETAEAGTAETETAVVETAEAAAASTEVPEAAAAPGVPEGAEAEPAPARKRRVRTGTLFAGALVLGVLGGVGTGYAVQAGRPATPLPPLALTEPRYAPAGVYQGFAPATLPASQDDATLTDGDLTKLLLPIPPGAHEDDDLWNDQMIEVAQEAYLCDDPVNCFTGNYSDGVVAIADTGWKTGNGDIVEIRIYRFAPGAADNGRTWVGDAANTGTPITLPDDIEVNGGEYSDDGQPTDFAQAAHGDLVVSFWVTSGGSDKPDASIIDGLITDQIGRL